jgi:hypothetical protein
MMVVIQCAASKQPEAGHLETAAGTPVRFVADPAAAPTDRAVVYARPDDPSDRGLPWRNVLLEYNHKSRHNPLKLSPAWRLYDNRTYGRLVERMGIDHVYILSAGWGLISAAFLTPYYDITFSQAGDAYKRRRHSDRYRDLQMLPKQTREPIVFFGGKDYLPLFATLTSSVSTTKTVFYNSAQVPQMPGYVLRRFETRTRTNWQYECANAFVDGVIDAGA